MKQTLLLVFFLFSGLFFHPIGWSNERTSDLMVNHFHLALPKTDRATLYVKEDKEFLFFPTFDNQDYVQICSGSWKANNRSRTVTLRGKDKCRLLNGTYKVTHQPDGLYLHNSSKNFVLEHLD